MDQLHDVVKGPAVAADTVVLGLTDNKLKVLLIKVSSGPYDQKWALPGGLVKLGESPETTAIRVLKDKANIQSGYLEQLYTFGNPYRDSRGQVVSVAHLLLIKDIESLSLSTSEFYSDISWHPVASLPNMAFDHGQIVDFAVTRLKSKLNYSNIIHSFLPSVVSIEDIEHVYEAIFEEDYDPNDFKNKIESLKFVTPIGDGKYQFNQESINYFD